LSNSQVYKASQFYKNKNWKQVNSNLIPKIGI
jgi:hypothetical protein